VIRDGWPEPVIGAVARAREAGVALGSMTLEEPDWEVLRATVVLALRIRYCVAHRQPSSPGRLDNQRPDGTETVV
jgi:hypothetical protein